MTEQEQQLINGLAEQIRNAPAPQIDRDANNMIQRTIGARPDALYILTQTVLLQQMALDQAKAQIEDLKRQTAPQPQTSFLPGSSQPDYPPSRPGGYQGSSYQNASYAAPAAQEPPPPPPPSGGGFSGFLHNVATTAAGVIAGDIAFDALSSLFGGHRGGYYGGGGFLGGGGGETIINNYYDDDRRDRDDRDDSRFAQAADQDQDISPDIDDERDNSGDSFDDDSSSDDSSSFDDGGGN
jgi:uncharacterized protein